MKLDCQFDISAIFPIAWGDAQKPTDEKCTKKRNEIRKKENMNYFIQSLVAEL